MPDAYEQMNPAPVSPEAEAPRQGGGSGWVAWVVGIVLVILVGGGLYYYYQYIKIPELNKKVDDLQNQINQLNAQKAEPTDETADWKTYDGSEFGITFKYPINYSTKESSVNLVGDVAGNQVIFGESNKLTTTQSAYVLIFPVKSTYNLNEPNGMDPISSSSTTIDNLSAKKYVGSLDDVYVVVSNQRRYEIYEPKTLSQTDKDNFEKILETFQFTD